MRFVMQLEFISNNGHTGITLGRVRQQVRRKVFVQYRHSPRYARMPHAVMLVLARETLSAGVNQLFDKYFLNLRGFHKGAR